MAAAGAPLPATPDAAVLVGAGAALALLIAAVYGIGRRLASARVGVVAAIAATSFPLVSGQSRQFMLDLPDAAMTSAAILALLVSERFARRRGAAIFGAVLGLALLTKWTCVFFIALPFAAAVASALRSLDRGRRLRHAAGALMLAGTIAAPWYVLHLWGIARDSTKFAYAIGVREGDPPVFSAASFLYYLRALPDAVSWPWLALVAAGAAFALVGRRRFGLLAAWIASGWIVLTLIRNKDERYWIPMLPAAALLAAVPLERLGRRAALGAAATIGLVGLAAAWRRDPPRREHWPVEEVVSFIQRASPGRPRPRLRVVPDVPRFERHAFEYAAERRRFALDVGTWFRFPVFTDFVLTKDGDQGERPEPAEVMREIDDPEGSFSGTFRVAWRAPTPDGTATLWVRDPVPIDDPAPDAVGDRLRAAIEREIAARARSIDGLAIEIEPAGPDGDHRGLFRRVAVTLRSAEILRRPGAAEGVRVADVAVETRDVAIDAHRLLRDGSIRVLALGEVAPKLTVSDRDANAALAALRGPRATVAFDGGRISLRVRPRSGPAVDVTLTPRIEGENVGFRIDAWRVGGVPFPAFAAQALTAGNNPLLKPLPCRLGLASLRIAGGTLGVNEPAPPAR